MACLKKKTSPIIFTKSFIKDVCISGSFLYYNMHSTTHFDFNKTHQKKKTQQKTIQFASILFITKKYRVVLHVL